MQINRKYLVLNAQGFYNTAFQAAKVLQIAEGDDAFSIVAPAIVNFSFAIELLLKGILHVLGKDLDKHNLSALYNQIPRLIKSDIENEYQQQHPKRCKDLGFYKLTKGADSALLAQKPEDFSTVKAL